MSTNEELHSVKDKLNCLMRRIRERAERQAVQQPSIDSNNLNAPHSEALSAHTRPLDGMADYISRGAQFIIDRDLVKCRKAV